MPSAIVNGLTLNFEVMGNGPAVVLTPGGRRGLKRTRPLAELLAASHRVLIHDRRNCGSSDVLFDGEASEWESWADDLYGLALHLDMLPAYFGGVSAGASVSLLVALRHLEAVKGLLLWTVAGGRVAAEHKSAEFYSEFSQALKSGGMPALSDTPYFSELLSKNPGSRERLLAMDSSAVLSVIIRWRDYILRTANNPVLAVSADEDALNRIEVPAFVLPGRDGDDGVHPRSAGEQLQRALPRSQLVTDLITQEEQAQLEAAGGDAFAETQIRLAPVIRDFIKSVESAA